MLDIFNTVLVLAAGIPEDHPLASVLTVRRDIIELTEKSHDAVLKPEPSGGFSHSERAALACRIARLNLEDELAAHYEGMVQVEDALAASPSFTGGSHPRLKAILRHADLVTMNPKYATAGDITALQEAGIPEDDIVRLSELIAFVNYQIRVVVGLRLMLAAS